MSKGAVTGPEKSARGVESESERAGTQHMAMVRETPGHAWVVTVVGTCLSGNDTCQSVITWLQMDDKIHLPPFSKNILKSSCGAIY